MEKDNLSPRALIVFGVSGCGKSTVGQALAARLNIAFADADDFHPPENIAKMQSGTPLTDVDRAPWLAALHTYLKEMLANQQHVVLACSALKQAYRERLQGDLSSVTFIYLHGTFDVILKRLQARQGHFMPADLLQSQLDTLEPPTDTTTIQVSVDQSVDNLVDNILFLLKTPVD